MGAFPFILLMWCQCVNTYFRDDSEGKRVKRICAFYDERYGKNRSITDIDWSPKVSDVVQAR